MDDILLIGNDVGAISITKVWLAKQFDIKDLGDNKVVFLILYMNGIPPIGKVGIFDMLCG